MGAEPPEGAPPIGPGANLEPEAGADEDDHVVHAVRSVARGRGCLYSGPMRRAAKPWPPVIRSLVDTLIAAAKDEGVHGGVRVDEDDAAYYVVVKVPKGETVPTRAARR